MPFGFVLVGGRSSRMGRSKPLLTHRGVPLARIAADKLAFVCGRAALVGKDPRPYARIPYPFVPDGVEEHAAIYGVLAALDWSPEETNLVLAADLPRCPEALLASLLAEAEQREAKALVPISGGRLQPLCAVWRRSALPLLHHVVLGGSLALVHALEAIGAETLSEEEVAALPGGQPESFDNVNTPEDYALLESEDPSSDPP